MTAALTVGAVVLAAGEGTRMRSPLPKVLHCLGGRPMIDHVLGALAGVAPAPEPVAVVVGRGADAVRAGATERARDLALSLVFATQSRRLGTGHAVLQAAPVLAGRAEAVLVVYGDVPLVTPGTLTRLLAAHRAARGAVAALVSAYVDEPTGYGRVVRAGGRDGDVARIVEDRDATPAERTVREINAGLYVFDDAWLWPALRQLAASPNGEIYLTDLVGAAVSDGRRVVAVTVDDAFEVAGVNTVEELARADAALRARGRRDAS